MSIEKYRKRLDALDEMLQGLLKDRFSLSREIGLYKFKERLPIRDERREEEIIARISGEFQEEIRDLYRLLFEKSRNLQKIDYFLAGGDLSYSFSPLLYSLFGLKNYGLFETADFGEVLEKDFKAINITNPHKKSAFLACRKASEIAKRTQSVNVIVREGDGLFGDNTDYFGFNALLDRFGFDPEGKKCLVIGRGASAKTLALALKDRGASAVTFLVRKKENADEAEIGEYGNYRDYHFVINATPYGTYPENQLEPLFPLKDFRNLEGAIDVIYNPALTPLLREAEKYRIPAADGLYMLAAQAFRNLSYFGIAPLKNLEEAYREAKVFRANIVLIGMPYSGKTSLGKYLSVISGKEFVDIDGKLEETGRDLKSLYPDVAAFRKAEAEATVHYAKGWNQVIACGGGIVLNPEAMAALRGNGTIIFLDVRPDTLLKRMDGSRLLIKNEDDLWRTYRERIALYRKYADITFSEDTEINEITERIYEYFGN